MSSRRRRATGALMGVLLVAALAACDGAGDVSIRNDSGAEVTVQIEDETLEVTPDGGVVLLDVGCVTGDITVQYDSGETVVLPGPVCPDQAIVISEETASLVQAATAED